MLSQDGTTHDVLDWQGEGPGDYNSVSAVYALGEDSIMVANRNLGRVTLFVGGSVARTVNIRTANGLGVRGIGSSGHLLLTTGVFSWGFEEDWLPGHMARFDMDTGALDTIASYDHLSRLTAGAAWNPIAADGQVTVANGQFVYTRTDRPEITWRLPDGTIAQIVRWQAEPAPLTEEVLEGLEAIYRVGNRRANPGASEADIERITASDLAPYRAALGYPMPLFNDPIGDAEGRVWLPAYRPGSWRFDVPDYTVISAEGEWLGTVGAPPRVRILDVAGGLVLGLLRGETDAHSVVVEGPGDVSYVGATFALEQDRFLAVDIFLDRLTIFAGGSVERTVDIRHADGLSVLGVGASGQLLGTANSLTPDFEEEWLPGHMAVFDMETGIVDTVVSYDLLARAPPGMRWNPIGAAGWVAVAAGQFVYARSDRPQVTWHRPDGTVTQIVRWQTAAAPPTEELLEGIEEGFRAGNRLANPGAGEADIERMTNDNMARYRAVLGDPMPLFTTPFGDSEGRVWLPSYRPGDETEGTPHYTVISADGEWLGTVEAPPRFRILDVAGGLVLGVQLDDMDVENVVVYELVGDAS